MFPQFIKYMLLAGWEVRIGKNCDRGLENDARGRRPRAAFSSPRSQFFPIRTDSKKAANNIIIFSACRKLAYKFVYATLPLNLTSKRASKIKYYTRKDVLKNRFISNYFMLVHLVP